jgi:hypothetical protein
MRTSLGTHAPRPRFPVTLASTAPVLPDLSRYNNPASANFDFIRGIRYGRLAAGIGDSSGQSCTPLPSQPKAHVFTLIGNLRESYTSRPRVKEA